MPQEEHEAVQHRESVVLSLKTVRSLIRLVNLVKYPCIVGGIVDWI